MYTKKYPFTANSIPGIQKQLLNDEPDYSEIKDEKLVDLLKHMFIKNPHNRPAMGEIAMHSWLSKDGTVPVVLYEHEEVQEGETPTEGDNLPGTTTPSNLLSPKQLSMHGNDKMRISGMSSQLNLMKMTSNLEETLIKGDNNSDTSLSDSEDEPLEDLERQTINS